MKKLLSLLFLATFVTPLSAADKVADTSYKAPDGSRVLRHEIVVKASLADAYAAFATPEGWRTWAVPFAQLSREFGVGAVLETSYNPAAKTGDPNNIKNQVLAYIPERMFAFQAVQAPAGFQHADLLAKIFSVAEFESVNANTTRVRLSMLGYGQGAAFDDLYGKFGKGNAWTLQKLGERFETGPVDWKRAVVPMQ